MSFVRKVIIELIAHIDRVYIIDNSTYSNELLDVDKGKVYYQCNKKNLGIASALNIACNKAISEGYEYVLTMDQDSFFDKDNLEEYIKNINNSSWQNIAIFSPNYKYRAAVNHIEDYEFVQTAITSGSIINLDIYKKINGFKNELFIDEVDYEYCLRSAKMGYRIVNFPSIFLNHNLGVMEKLFLGLSHRTHTPVRYYYMTRNVLYMWKTYFFSFPLYVSKKLHPLLIKIIVIVFFENQKKEKLYYMLRGVIDFFRNKYGEFKK